MQRIPEEIRSNEVLIRTNETYKGLLFIFLTKLTSLVDIIFFKLP